MVKKPRKSPAASMRVEFRDGLRGYRFADELRRRRGTAMGVWHKNATVVVEFPQSWESEEGIAALVAGSGGIVTTTVPHPGASAAV